MNSDFIFDKLLNLRREIHHDPELSGFEKKTSDRIEKFISIFDPDEVISDLGGHGLAFIFRGQEKGPTVLFRCELDALPINEENVFGHKSSSKEISHKCGHDGHMAILAGIAALINKEPIKKGKLILLFQPAEETGQGAKLVLSDKKFEGLNPDFVFALHNLPGFPMNYVLVKDGTFSCASTGMIIKLKGKTSHAAEPDKGLNPASAIAKIISELRLYSIPEKEGRILLVTPIYCQIGKKAFGTNPGNAELLLTLRASNENDFIEIKNRVLAIVKKTAMEEGLEMNYNWVEEFPVTANNSNCNSIVKQSAEQAGLSLLQINKPFRWSEDFGHFLKKYPGAIFGLGAGIKHPALHNPDYDFPDELIKTGIKIFYNIYRIILH